MQELLDALNVMQARIHQLDLVLAVHAQLELIL